MAKEATFTDLLNSFEKQNQILETDVTRRENEKKLQEFEKKKELKLNESQLDVLKQVKASLKEDTLQTEEERREANKRAEALIKVLDSIDKNTTDLKGLGGGGGGAGGIAKFFGLLAAPFGFAGGAAIGLSERIGELVSFALDADDRKGVGVKKSREIVKKSGQRLAERFAKAFSDGVDSVERKIDKGAGKVTRGFGTLLRGIGSFGLIADTISDANRYGLKRMFDIRNRVSAGGQNYIDGSKLPRAEFGRVISDANMPRGPRMVTLSGMDEAIESLGKFGLKAFNDVTENKVLRDQMRKINSIADEYKMAQVQDDFTKSQELYEKYMKEMDELKKNNSNMKRITARYKTSGPFTGIINFILRSTSGALIFFDKSAKFIGSIFEEEFKALTDFGKDKKDKLDDQTKKVGDKASKIFKTILNGIKGVFVASVKFGKSVGRAIPFLGAIIAFFDSITTSFKRGIQSEGNIVQKLLSFIIGAIEGLAKSVIGGIGDLGIFILSKFIGLFSKDAEVWLRENVRITAAIESIGDYVFDLVNSPIETLKKTIAKIGLLSGATLAGITAVALNPASYFNPTPTFNKAFAEFMASSERGFQSEDAFIGPMTPNERSDRIEANKQAFFDDAGISTGGAFSFMSTGGNDNSSTTNVFGTQIDPIGDSLVSSR